MLMHTVEALDTTTCTDPYEALNQLAMVARHMDNPVSMTWDGTTIVAEPGEKFIDLYDRWNAARDANDLPR